jgi:hypothetical protein
MVDLVVPRSWEPSGIAHLKNAEKAALIAGGMYWFPSRRLIFAACALICVASKAMG